MKKIIKDYSFEEATALFISFGEKQYRAKQLFTWMFERNVTSFSEMTDFSKDLRSYLDENFIISPLTLEETKESNIDGTVKFLFRTSDGHFIESVLLKNDATDEGRLTVCISSQVGCAMGCVFCETGKIGFKRNLTSGEILDQLCHVRRLSGLRNNNIVFMGMGEPFLNYDNVMKAADIMNYTFGFHISVRRITISTCGIRDGIERFIDEERPYNLAISLNDTLPEKRKVNMPIEKKYPIIDIAMLLSKKLPASRNRLTLEYVMRKDNISSEDAKRLKKMFKFSRIKINLIPLNSSPGNPDVPTEEEIELFKKELVIMNVPISVRKSLGRDIDGACGQLSGKRYKNEN